MEEKELKGKIKELYLRLQEEEKGRYAPGGYMNILLPDGYSYYSIALEIWKYAKQLSEINERYCIGELAYTLPKEVELVRDYEYKYIPGTNKIKENSRERMAQLMRNATAHIHRYFIMPLDIEND